MQTHLKDRLMIWAADKGDIAIRWVGDALEMASTKGRGGTVYTFPPRFWKRVDGVPNEAQERELHAVLSFIQESFVHPADPYIRFVEVPDPQIFR